MTAKHENLLCPSAQPEMEGAAVFGIVNGTAAEPRVGYLTEPVILTEEIRVLSEPVEPTEVFRIAAPCATNRCKHFDGADCRLAARVAELLPEAVDAPPPCSIRPQCRWWRQEGKAACMRCPVVVTQIHAATAAEKRLAYPTD